MITKPSEKDSRIKRFGIVTAALIAVVLSYGFVLQPAYAPPVADIYDSGAVVEVDTTQAFIQKDKLGKYTLVAAGHPGIPLPWDTLGAYVAAGYEVKEEAGTPEGVIKTRLNNGRYQYRRWNQAQGAWLDPCWTDFS